VDRVLDAAAELFWKNGYAATTTREIAAALDIQQASLYHHISSKQGLLYELCVSSMRQILVAIPAKLDGIACPLERILVFARAHLKGLLGHQKRNAVMLTEFAGLPPRHRAEAVELRQQYADLMRSAVEQAQREGAIRTDISSTLLTLTLLNTLNWTAVWFREDRDLPAEQLADVFVKIYLHGAASADAPRLRAAAETGAVNPNRAAKAVRIANRPGSSGETAMTRRLLRAAVALFSRKGYVSTSTREVAALLGLQKASLYYHVPSKEELLYLICKSLLERIRQDVKTAIEAVEHPGERLRTLICAHTESMLRDQAGHAVTFGEMRHLSRERLTQVLSLRDSYEELVRRALEEGQRAGAVRRDIYSKYLCLGLLGMLNRVPVWYRKRGPLSPGQLGRLLAAIYMDGVAARK